MHLGQAMNAVSLVNKAISIRKADKQKEEYMINAGSYLTRMIFLQMISIGY